MANKHRASALLRDEYSIPEIETELGITISSVRQYLYQQVVEGELKRSDILFAIPPSERQAIEDGIQQTGTDTNFSALGNSLHLAGLSIHQEIVRIYLDLRYRSFMGDMFELISDIEITLHNFVKKTLVNEFGSDEWWRKGFPLQITSACAIASEEDTEPAGELFCYTNFIHLQGII